MNFSNVFTNPKVIEDLNKHFYAVKINAHHPDSMTFKGKQYGNPDYNPEKGLNEANAYHEILFELEAPSIPSLVFLNEKLEISGTEMGLKLAEDLRSILHMYKSM